MVLFISLLSQPYYNPAPTQPSLVGFCPKKVLEVKLWLPRAIRAVCLLIYVYLENDFLWLSIANEEELC